jgi:preprotein translocase subunit SecG
MDQVLTIIQIAVAAILALLIIIQPKGVGLGQVFGGEGNVYRTKRGAERLIFNATIFFAVAFTGLAIARLLI